MFKTYYPRRTWLQTPEGELDVEGFGSVELSVKRSPNTRRSTHGTIQLEFVLYAPDSKCNIIGTRDSAFPRSYLLPVVANKDHETISAEVWEGNKRICYFTRIPGLGIHALKLSNPPIGPRFGRSALDGNTRDVIDVRWPDFELRAWEDKNGHFAHRFFGKRHTAYIHNYWGTVGKFFKSLQLDIGKTKDCETARAALYHIMELHKLDLFKGLVAMRKDGDLVDLLRDSQAREYVKWKNLPLQSIVGLSQSWESESESSDIDLDRTRS